MNARPRTASGSLGASRRARFGAGGSATDLLAIMGGDIDRARLEYASRGSSSKVGRVRQLKKSRSGAGGARNLNYNFHSK